jgi:hypothetical protein
VTSTATVQLLLSSACVDNLRQEWFKSEVFIENFAFFCLQNVTSFAFGSFAQVFLLARGTLSLLLLSVVALSPQSLSDSSSLSQIRGALISFVLNSTKKLFKFLSKLLFTLSSRSACLFMPFVARTHSRSAKQVNFLCSRLPVALLPVFPFFAVT